MKYGLNEKIWIGIQFLILFLLSSLLYSDINKRIEVEGERIIGTITFKQRTVQRKYVSHVVWEDLDQNFPLRNKDSIRTATEADAEITLNDGTKINLSENSMILLNLEEEKTSIDFAYGSVSAKNENGKPESTISIKSGDSSVSIGSGDVKLSKKENNDLSVTVEKGVAEISTAGSIGQKIGADEKAIVGANSDKVEIKKVDLKLNSPPDNTRYFSNSDEYLVNFDFTKDNSIKSVNFEIASSPDFKKLSFSKKISDTQVSVKLKEGIYYWRVIVGKDISQIRKFNVLRNRPVNLVAPMDGARTSNINKTTYVNFSWSKNDLAANYKLDVSPNSDFSSDLQSSVTNSTYISLPLEKGKFYWRVGANVPNGDGSSSFLYSSIRNFEVTEPEKGKAPTLFNPSAKSILYSILIEKKGILFNWSRDVNHETYEFQLSNSSKFDSVLFKKNSTSNFIEFKEKISPGVFYWRVSGKSKEGVLSENSAVSTFEVKEVSSLRIFLPEDKSQWNGPDIVSKGVAFSWEKLPILGKYQLVISGDSNFSNIYKSIQVANNHFTLKDIPAGDYYWKVSLRGDSGESYLISNTNTFSIRYLPETPKIMYPKPNVQIPYNTNSIKFQWTKGNSPNYQFTISQRVGETSKEILTKSVSNRELILEKSELPEPGTYEWSIVGLGDSGLRSSESISRFQISPPIEEKPILATEEESRLVTNLLTPLEAQSINISKQNQVLFSWSSVSGVNKYRFKIYDGKKEIHSIIVSGSSYIFQKLNILDRKLFTWSVAPIKGNIEKESKTGTFKIELDPIKEEIEIISPDIQYDE